MNWHRCALKQAAIGRAMLYLSLKSLVAAIGAELVAPGRKTRANNTHTDTKQPPIFIFGPVGADFFFLIRPYIPTH